MNQEMDNWKTGIPCRYDEAGSQVPERKVRPFRSAVLDLVVQEAEVPACVVDAVMSEGEGHHLELAGVRNLQAAVDRRNQAQVEGVGQAMASFVVAAVVVPVLGAEVALLQDETEASDQGLAGKLEGGQLDSGDPRDSALALDHSFLQL